jgi:hypothetical protein
MAVASKQGLVLQFFQISLEYRLRFNHRIERLPHLGRQSVSSRTAGGLMSADVLWVRCAGAQSDPRR